MTLRKKLLILIAVAAFGLITLAVGWYSNERTLVYDDHRAQLKSLVDEPLSLIARYEKLEADGKLTRTDAQRQAIEAIRVLRFEGNNYFWINDMQPAMIMHPTKPELDGKDLSSLTDPTGKHLFVEMVDQIKKSGSGYVEYQWAKPGQPADKLFPKMSYVRSSQNWGWVVGAGMYVDDIDAILRTCMYKALGVTIPCLVLLLIVSYFVFRTVLARLAHFNERISDLAAGEGDLTMRIDPGICDEFRPLGDNINAFLDKLQNILNHVATNARDLGGLAEQLESASSSNALGAGRQRDQTEQVATAMAEMSSTVDQIAANAGSANDLSHGMANAAQLGDQTVNTSISQMSAIAESVTLSAQKVDSLGQRSQQIGAIVGVINDIADQTNLLALNAAIEAARAGEQGRGFAVVADEVRKLAERTTSSTQEISAMITSMQSETKEAVGAMNENRQLVEKGSAATKQAGEALREIIDNVNQLGGLIAQIATAASEQSSAAAHINGSIEEISGITAESAQNTERSAASLHELAQLAQSLNEAVSQFRLQANARSGASVPRAPRAPRPSIPDSHYPLQ